jgi:hypothetical protein
MTLAADVRALWCALHDLRDAVLPVRMQVVEDLPEEVAPQPVRAIGDGLEAVFGRLQEAIAELSAVIDTDGECAPRDRVAVALGRCHTTFLALGKEWAEQVGSYRCLAPLVVSTRRRGGPWREWTRSVVAGVLACERPREQVHRSLLACWQGLAEYSVLPDPSPYTSAVTKER